MSIQVLCLRLHVHHRRKFVNQPSYLHWSFHVPELTQAWHFPQHVTHLSQPPHSVGKKKNHPRCNAFTSFSWDFILPSTSNGDVKYMTSHVMSLLEPFTWFYQSRLNMKSWNPPFWVVQDGKTMSSTPTFPCKAGKPTWLNKKTSSQKVFQKKTKPAGDILQIIDEPNSLYTLIPWKTLVIYIKLKPRQNLNKTQNCYRHNQRCCSPLQVQQPSPS